MEKEEKSRKQEVLNRTLRDLRTRVDTLAKSIYLIGGGAIVLSVNLYLAKKNQLDKILCYLKTSWILFGLSILLFAVVTGCLIVQAYRNTEYYREKIASDQKIEEQPKRCFDYAALVFGVLGFLLFALGLIFLIISAASL
jgi:hypothetical protein